MNIADIAAKAMSDSTLIERYATVSERVDCIIRREVIPSGASIATLASWMITLPSEIVTAVLRKSEEMNLTLSYTNLVVLTHHAIHDAVMTQIKIRK